MNSAYLVTKTGISLSVHVQPGSSRPGWAGMRGERLKLKLSAKPLSGQANLQLLEFLADYFAVPKSCIRITHGRSSRDKTVSIEAPIEQLLSGLERLLNAAPDT